MAASCSESESEEIPPLGPRPGPGVRPGPSYLSDDGSDDEEQRQRPWSELNKTRRGSYDRSTERRKKVSHAEQAHECFEAVRATALIGKCSSGCIFDCAGTLSRNEMMQCVEHSYGAISWISDEALKVRVRKCAQLHCVPVDHVCSSHVHRSRNGVATLRMALILCLKMGSRAGGRRQSNRVRQATVGRHYSTASSRFEPMAHHSPCSAQRDTKRAQSSLDVCTGSLTAHGAKEWQTQESSRVGLSLPASRLLPRTRLWALAACKRRLQQASVSRGGRISFANGT